MKDDKRIHFGDFLYWRREAMDLSVGRFAAKVGISERQLWAIEGMEKPRSEETTLRSLAHELGYADSTELDKAWRNTPVEPQPPRKKLIVYRPAGAIRENIARQAELTGRTPGEIITEILTREFKIGQKLIDSTDSEMKIDPADLATTAKRDRMAAKQKHAAGQRPHQQ